MNEELTKEEAIALQAEEIAIMEARKKVGDTYNDMFGGTVDYIQDIVKGMKPERLEKEVLLAETEEGQIVYNFEKLSAWYLEVAQKTFELSESYAGKTPERKSRAMEATAGVIHQRAYELLLMYKKPLTSQAKKKSFTYVPVLAFDNARADTDVETANTLTMIPAKNAVMLSKIKQDFFLRYGIAWTGLTKSLKGLIGSRKVEDFMPILNQVAGMYDLMKSSDRMNI